MKHQFTLLILLFGLLPTILCPMGGPELQQKELKTMGLIKKIGQHSPQLTPGERLQLKDASDYVMQGNQCLEALQSHINNLIEILRAHEEEPVATKSKFFKCLPSCC